MRPRIDWNLTLDTREKSYKGVLVVDQEFIDAFLGFLKYFAKNGENIGYFHLSKGLQPPEQLRLDGFIDDIGSPDPCSFLEKCCTQISEHRRLWLVHHNKTEHITIETSIVVKTDLRYVKFQFEAKNKKIGSPDKIKLFLINYHKINKGNPKVYWSYEKI